MNIRYKFLASHWLIGAIDTWSLEDLVKEVGGVDRAAGLKALYTWVDHGVLKDMDDNVFNLLEYAEDHAARTTREARPAAPAGMELPAPVNAQHQQAEQMRVYWKFIEGMLTNLGSLPLDRIQAMLKYAPGYDQTAEQLSAFMEAAKREQLVVARDGEWRLASA